MMFRVTFLLGLIALLAAAEPAKLPAKQIEVAACKDPIRFIQLPAGAITLTDSKGNSTQHKIAPIWFAVTEVTWTQYEPFYGRVDLPQDRRGGNSDATNRPSPPYLPPDRGWGYEGMPIQSIHLNAAQKYCTWLSKKTGRTIRLPTSAEWTYACRANGAGTALEARVLREFAWFRNNCDRPQEVAQKKPNAWGLYDMLGNVGEWVEMDKTSFAIAGGCYNDHPRDLHSLYRLDFDWRFQVIDPEVPQSRSWLTNGAGIGVRLVMEPE